jgi:hypothetical protein
MIVVLSFSGAARGQCGGRAADFPVRGSREPLTGLHLWQSVSSAYGAVL